jgi:heme/copper-type cytochrome/quinol oxidase subunit 1
MSGFVYGAGLVYLLGVLHMMCELMIEQEESEEEIHQLEYVMLIGWPILAVMTIFYTAVELVKTRKDDDR